MDSLSRRSLLIGGASLGVAALGSAALWYRNESRADAAEDAIPEFRGPSARLDDVVGAAPPDVCIIGSGPAGTSLGLLLAQAGLRTLIIEAGVNPSQMKRGAAYERLNTASQSGDLPYALTTTRAMMPGGTSALWTGNTPRLLPIDFERNAYTPEGCGWPVSYASMDPHYEKAEDLLAVNGESNVRYMPPRSHPLSNERRGGNPAVKQLLKRADIVAFDTFRSRTPHGGPVRVARDLLPKFAKFPAAIFLPGVTVRRLVGDSPEHIDGVLVRDPSGREELIRARVFVLAAGAVESARRLLLSKSEYFPEGLGNPHDQVGRTFSDHYITDFTGSLAARSLNLAGTLPQTVRSFQFYETFKSRGLGSVSLAISLRATPDPSRVELRIAGDCELAPDASNRVTLSESTIDAFGDPAAHLHFSATERDLRTQTEMTALIRGIYQRLGAHGPEQIGMRWGHHHLSTVRMGHNPRTSVVDAELQLHGLRNGYVLSSGNFVTSGPANPTLLIVAFAHRLASHIVSRMREGAYAEARKRAS